MPLKTPADLAQTDPPLPPRDTLPTMYDLPSEDPEEPGLPDVFHYLQPPLLQETFCPPDYPPERFFAAGDLNLYYDVHHPLCHKRPDWFAVLGVTPLYEQRDLRLSYVVWQEGVMPYIGVELLSPSTEKEDLGKSLRIAEQPPSKWEVYEQILRIPYYVTYDRYTGELRIFMLTENRYKPQPLQDQRLWFPELKLHLGLWNGIYQNLEHEWLRWYDAEGELIATAAERAEQEKKRAEKMAERLRALGIDPDEI